MKRIKKYIACALSAAMIMTSALAQGAVVSYAEEQDVGTVATAGDAEEADTSLEVETEAEDLEAQRDSKVTESGFEYEETDDGITITGYSGTITDVIIPSEIDGKTVNRIGYGAFAACAACDITSITIPSSIKEIEDWAFNNNYNLSSITVEAGNKVYDSRNDCNAIIETRSNTLIYGCQNTVIPDDVTCIGKSAFEACLKLTSVTIPDSVTSIGESAFESCGLTGITIPSSVTSIGKFAFAHCYELTSIKVDSDNKVYESRNDCNAIIETASDTLISGCQSTVIPETVTSIGDGGFLGCMNLTSITIPDSVTSIGEGAFSQCEKMTELYIPASVTSIGESAFYNCEKLTELYVPASVTNIGERAFERCEGLTSIKVDGDNKVYDSRNDCNAIIETSSNTLIYGCQNTVIPDDVTTIGARAFSGCSALTSLTIPNSVTFIILSNEFIECQNLTITCNRDSYAYKYAIDNNIPVNINGYAVTSITLSDTSKSMEKGGSTVLTSTVAPTDATNKAVTWSSGNTSVAKVDKDGKVTAVSAGTATITCTAADGTGVSASCEVTVTNPASTTVSSTDKDKVGGADNKIVSVKSVKLNKTTATVKKGKTVTLKATVSPSNATDKAVTWKSSNTKVATVSSSGKVTTKKVGTATITCITKDGKKKATCKITVTTPVTKVKLNKTKVTLKKGKSVKLKATVTPTKAYKKVTWKSSNTKVATVSKTGKVTAKKKGTATITCTAADGSGKKVTCKITVK